MMNMKNTIWVILRILLGTAILVASYEISWCIYRLSANEMMGAMMIFWTPVSMWVGDLWAKDVQLSEKYEKKER